jgi:hypothetical protein
MLVAGLVASAIITLAITYPRPSGVGAFTSVSTTTDTVTAISVSTITNTTSQTSTVISTVDLTKTLADAYLSHIGAIVSQNATALIAQYETNATMLWASPNGGPPHAGSFDGSANITRFYEKGAGFFNGSAFFPLSTFAVANETHSITMSNDDKAGKVTSHLIIYGDDAIARPEAAYFYDVSFDISYVLQGDRWLISTENLTYNNFSSCAAISLSPDGNVLTCQYGS